MRKTFNNPLVRCEIQTDAFAQFLDKLANVKDTVFFHAVQQVQREAFTVMKMMYDNMSGTKRKRRYMRKSLESVLFGKMPPVEKTKDGYTFSMLPPNNVLNEYPHLMWLEEGARANIDMQPYLVTPTGLKSITKVKALLLKTRREKGSNGRLKDTEIVRYLRVAHPAIPPRYFLKATNYFLKRYSSQIIAEHIDSYMKG